MRTQIYAKTRILQGFSGSLWTDMETRYGDPDCGTRRILTRA